jgi:RNA polymerase sigma factor
MAYLQTHKLLPIKELELLTGIKRKVLDKGRKYLIALALILSKPDFHSLKVFMQIPEEPEERV